MSTFRGTRSIRRVTAALAVVFAFTSLLVADVVTKKDGTKVEGTVTEDTTDHVTLNTKFGPVTLARADVDRVEKGGTGAADDFKSKREAVDKHDANPLNELADWCSENGLTREKLK